MREQDGHRLDMRPVKITDKIVRELKSPRTKDQLVVRDIVQVGFAVRITATGHRTFIFNYTCNGVQRRMRIGSPPSWSVARAREEVKKLRRIVDSGTDPLLEQRRARDEERLSDVWEIYRTDVLFRRAAKTQTNVVSIWDRLILPALGSRKISAILQQDIERLHRSVSKNTPTQSNRMLASLQHVFSKAIQWSLVEKNPVKGIERNTEYQRVRYLSEDELVRFLTALRKTKATPSTLAIEFLLLTGARTGETFRAKWAEFDLNLGVWEKPPSNTKTRIRHRIPLGPEALAILEQAHVRQVNEYVFPGQKGSHLTTIKTIFTRLCLDADIKDFRPHDLRHSYASFLAMQDVPLLTIGRLLGHAQPNTTARYAHLGDDVLRSATSVVGRKVASER